MYATQIRIRENLAHNSLDIYMFKNLVGGKYAIDFTGLIEEKKIIDEAAEIDVTPLRIKDSTAKLLYDELKRYYGDVHDSATLRKDYEHERARVDKLINRLIEGNL